MSKAGVLGFGWTPKPISQIRSCSHTRRGIRNNPQVSWPFTQEVLLYDPHTLQPTPYMFITLCKMLRTPPSAKCRGDCQAELPLGLKSRLTIWALGASCLMSFPKEGTFGPWNSIPSFPLHDYEDIFYQTQHKGTQSYPGYSAELGIKQASLESWLPRKVLCSF